MFVDETVETDYDYLYSTVCTVGTVCTKSYSNVSSRCSISVFLDDSHNRRKKDPSKDDN